MNNNNFSYLLVALLILLLGMPLAEDLDAITAPIARALAFSTLLAVGVWSLKGGGRYFAVGMTFAVVGILLNLLAVNTASQSLLYGSSAAIFGFLFVAVAHTFKEVALGTDITFNRLIGAVCVYMLLGTIWALAYSLIDMINPGSFRGFEPDPQRGWDSEWIYFSFVTMTTLGYGDISPVSATARALAYMQALFGQFYIAILVAGLVSSYISIRQEKNKSD